jgi:hypothetical protein
MPLDWGEPARPRDRAARRLDLAACIVAVCAFAMLGHIAIGLAIGEPQADLTPLVLIFLALGLYQRKRGAWIASWVLLGLTVFALTLFAILPLFVTHHELTILGEYQGMAPAWVAPLTALPYLPLLIAYLLVVREPASSVIAGNQRRRDRLDATQRRQMKLAAVIGLLIAALLGLGGWWLQQRIPSPIKTATFRTVDGNRNVIHAHGVEFGRLIFVLFQEEDGTISHRVNDGSPGPARLEWKDGEQITLPAEHQLFEIIDGEHFRRARANVTLAEYQAYLDHPDPAYRIDDLLAFVRQRRGRTGGAVETPPPVIEEADEPDEAPFKQATPEPDDDAPATDGAPRPRPPGS